MLQAPFGSIGAGWMTMPSPGFPWQLTQLGTIGSPFGSTQPGGFGIAPAVEGGVPGTTPVVGQAQTSGIPFGPSAPGWGMSSTMQTPLSTAFSIPDGITASGLLTGIALRRGQPQGPTSDQDVEEFIYDAVELLPGAGDVEVRCEGGRVALTGSVPHKRLKRDIGEIAWAVPGIADVQNTLSIATRRKARAFTRESESQPAPSASRKQA
jgi:BON domain